MEKKYINLLGEENLNHAWGQVNFGPNSKPIETIGKGLVKRALGYHVGSGMHFLLTELGLTDDEGKVRELGYDFLILPYEGQPFFNR